MSYGSPCVTSVLSTLCAIFTFIMSERVRRLFKSILLLYKLFLTSVQKALILSSEETESCFIQVQCAKHSTLLTEARRNKLNINLILMFTKSNESKCSC